jgi:predicted CXXCH cytochrome family protein
MRKLSVAAAVSLILVVPVLPGVGAEAFAQLKHNCDFCHNLHGGSSAQLSDYAVVEDLCLSCHGDGGPATVDRDGFPVAVPKGVDVHDGAKHSTATGCWECHDHEAEAGSNLKMVPELLTTPNSGDWTVIFTATSGTNSYADGDTDYDGICEVCHTGTVQHNNTGTTGQHNAGNDCGSCHGHDGGFAGAGGCTACHNTVRGTRRIIVSEFDRTSHHIDWALLPNGLAADSIPDADCQVCHDQSQHQLGNVRLWDVDDPGNTAASVVLTGDPSSSSTEAAKLTTFCLTCHDADGANGDTSPFSEGVSVPVVDATAWSSSSHNGAAAIAGCFGDGAFGCHASGHGSEKQKLLAPSGVAATAPALAEEEEGFCLNCHDSDGPASTDLATAYNQAINWVQIATGLSGNAELNDRHDVQYAAQSVSGAIIECTDCHDPHTATSSQPFILDPDPSDGHVVGTDYYFYSSTSDDWSEFCLDCHDGSYPTGVQGHTTTAITNIQSTWSSDGMGSRTGSSVDLRAGAGWAIGDIMPCWACHYAHPRTDADIGVNTLFSVVDTLRNKADTNYLFFKDRKASDPEIYAYAITNNSDKNDVTSGAYWCNSCHVRLSMTGKENCYGCHRHGDGGR